MTYEDPRRFVVLLFRTGALIDVRHLGSVSVCNKASPPPLPVQSHGETVMMRLHHRERSPYSSSTAHRHVDTKPPRKEAPSSRGTHFCVEEDVLWHPLHSTCCKPVVSSSTWNHNPTQRTKYFCFHAAKQQKKSQLCNLNPVEQKTALKPSCSRITGGDANLDHTINN